MKKVVAIGRKYPKYSTRHITLDFHHEWPPDPTPQVDWDQVAKQRLESMAEVDETALLE